MLSMWWWCGSNDESRWEEEGVGWKERSGGRGGLENQKVNKTM